MLIGAFVKEVVQSPTHGNPGVTGSFRGPGAMILFITLQAGVLNFFRGTGGKDPSPGEIPGRGAAIEAERLRAQLEQVQESLQRQEQKMVELSVRIQKLEQVIESGTAIRNGPPVDIDSPDLDRLREGEQYPKGDPGKTRYRKDFWKKVS